MVKKKAKGSMQGDAYGLSFSDMFQIIVIFFVCTAFVLGLLYLVPALFDQPVKTDSDDVFSVDGATKLVFYTYNDTHVIVLTDQGCSYAPQSVVGENDSVYGVKYAIGDYIMDSVNVCSDGKVYSSPFIVRVVTQ